MQKEKRIEWIDMVRGVAIMMVVMCHASEGLYFYSNVPIVERSIFSQLIGFALFTLGRMGVPLFLFISGYLLLPRKYDDEGCIRFWKRNLLQLLILTEIWIVFYNIFKSWLNQTPLSIVTLIKNMTFLAPTNMNHMWYLPMILGIYLTIPFVSNVLEKFSLKTILASFSVIFIYAFGIPTLNVLLVSIGYSPVANQLFLQFGGGVYGCYLLIGYFIYSGCLDRVKKLYLYIGMVVTFLVTILFQIYAYHHGNEYKVWYDFMLLLLTTVCMFSLFKNIKCSKRLDGFWKLLSKCSFGIYLIHEPVRAIVNRYFLFGDISVHLRVFIVWITTFFISWILVVCISKIPRIGKSLFLMR